MIVAPGKRPARLALPPPPARALPAASAPTRPPPARGAPRRGCRSRRRRSRRRVRSHPRPDGLGDLPLQVADVGLRVERTADRALEHLGGPELAAVPVE